MKSLAMKELKESKAAPVDGDLDPQDILTTPMGDK